MRDHIQARNMSDTFVIRYCLFHSRKVFTSIVSGPSSIEEIEKITHSKIYSCYQPQYCKFHNRKQIDSSPLHPPPSTVHDHCQITIHADDMVIALANKYAEIFLWQTDIKPFIKLNNTVPTTKWPSMKVKQSKLFSQPKTET